MPSWITLQCFLLLSQLLGGLKRKLINVNKGIRHSYQTEHPSNCIFLHFCYNFILKLRLNFSNFSFQQFKKQWIYTPIWLARYIRIGTYLCWDAQLRSISNFNILRIIHFSEVFNKTSYWIKQTIKVSLWEESSLYECYPNARFK